MRPSSQSRLKPQELDLSARDFFAKIATETAPDDRRGAILLVGGSDFRSTAVRRAQAPLRFDLHTSYWSHAALLTEWPSTDPATAKGVEATLDLVSGSQHQPGDNGVTLFTLARYLDDAAYPNLCVALIAGAPPTSGPTDLPAVDPGWRDAVIAAATQPNGGRPQFTFYNWIADWLRYVMLPYTTPNPLNEGIPHPGAAFIDYVTSVAGLDLTPGATSPSTAPEHLWATFLHWHAHVGERWGTLKVYSRVRQAQCTG
jgi:hypothetical protein